MLNEKGQVTLVDQEGQPLSASQRRMVCSDYADHMTTWLQSEMDTINGDMDLLLEIHQDEEYARHVHGIILRLAGVVLGLLPGIHRVVVSGYSQLLDSATGHINDDYLLSVAIDKARFAELNFEQLEQVDPIAALERFDLRREMTKTGIFRPVAPIDPV
jgi:hypothetical protein